MADDEVFSRLERAVARPRAEFAGRHAHPTLFRKVAALGHAIAQGHCFGNGNKRTAFAAMQFMLNLNGWFLVIPDAYVALMMMRIATNRNRMNVEQISWIIGAFARRASEKGSKIRFVAEQTLRNGQLAIKDFPDIYPAPAPRTPPATYALRATAIVNEHWEQVVGEDREMFEQSFSWPSKMQKIVTTWMHMMDHAERQKTAARLCGKRAGRRRRPHRGGRSVPKLCGQVRRRALARTNNLKAH